MTRRAAPRIAWLGAAALFTAAYAGYLVPFVVDENAVRFLTESYDLDRDASRIAHRDGTAGRSRQPRPAR